MNDVLVWFSTAALAIIIILVIFAYIKNRYFTSKGNEKIIRTDKKAIDVAGLYAALGYKENIASVDSHQSRLILEIRNYDKVNFDQIKNYGITSITKTTKKLTLVVGNKAKTLHNYISKKIN